MCFRVWVALAMGLVILAAGCTQTGDQPSSESETPRLEIDRPDMFWAEPKVVQSCEGLLGQTALHWKVEGISAIEVHVGRPDGPLFAMAGPVGSADTGHWVRDNMIFYLIDPSTSEVLASCTVRVTSAGCPGSDTDVPSPGSGASADASL